MARESADVIQKNDERGEFDCPYCGESTIGRSSAMMKGGKRYHISSKLDVQGCWELSGKGTRTRDGVLIEGADFPLSLVCGQFER